MLKLRQGNTEPVTPEKRKLTAEADLKISPPKMAGDVAMGMATSPVAVAAPVPATKAVLKGESLRVAVMQLLQEGSAKPEGTSLAQLCVHFSSNYTTEMNGLVQKLSDSGEVYNTIDDSHFSVI